MINQVFGRIFKKSLFIRISSFMILTGAILFNRTYEIKASTFVDIEGHWAQEAVTLWADRGVINGYEGLFRPEDNITIGEFSAILDKIMNYNTSADYDPLLFSDIYPEDWYFDIMLRLCEADVISPNQNGELKPQKYLTRSEGAVMLAKAFSLEPREGRTDFIDNNNIDVRSRPYVKAMHGEGYITGYKFLNGYEFRPEQNITRAEAIAMIDGMVKGYAPAGGIVEENVKGNMVVSLDGTVLKDIIIEGNLYITQGVGEGKILVDNVIVDGDVIIKGGGNAITFSASRLNNIVLDKEYGLEIEFMQNTKVKKVIAKNNVSLHSILTGDGYILEVVIPDGFPESSKVALFGDFANITNLSGYRNVVTTGAVTPSENHGNNNPQSDLPYGVVDTGESRFISATRISDKDIVVSYKMDTPGTLYFLILKKGAPSAPTDRNIMDQDLYMPLDFILDYNSVTVYANELGYMSFDGHGRILKLDEQGHTVYALFRADNGSVARFQSNEVYLDPEINYVRIDNEVDFYVTFNSYFHSAEAVMETYNVAVLDNNGSRLADVPFVVNKVDDDELSNYFKFTLTYDVKLKENHSILVYSKNSFRYGISEKASDVFNSQGLNLSYCTITEKSNGVVELSGFVSEDSVISIVATIEYVQDYFRKAFNIANELDRDTYDSLEVEVEKGKFIIPLMEDAVFGISGNKYVYVTAKNPKTNEFSSTVLLIY